MEAVYSNTASMAIPLVMLLFTTIMITMITTPIIRIPAKPPTTPPIIAAILDPGGKSGVSLTVVSVVSIAKCHNCIHSYKNI